MAPVWTKRHTRRCGWSGTWRGRWLKTCRWRMGTMTDHVEAADAYEAWLDATVGIEPALIEAEPRQAPADRCVVNDDHKADWALRQLGQLETQKRRRAAFVAEEIECLQA